MPPSQLQRRSISALISTAEVFRCLKPAAFAALLYVDNDEYRNQDEIATAIGCHQSTVSIHLSSLTDLPLPLVLKQGHPFVVTKAGREIVDLIDGMATRLGVDLHTIAWDDSEEMKTVEALFMPLSNSRSTLPFFILWALGIRGGAISLLQTRKSVAFETLITDIEDLYQDRDQRVTVSQIRKVLTDRFVSADVVEIDAEETLTLTEKGCEHARLIDRLAELIEETPEKNDEPTTSPTTEQGLVPNTEDFLGETPAEQAIPQSFRATFDHTVGNVTETSHTLPPLLPAYCLPPTAGKAEESDPTVLPEPVLLLTSTRVDELASAVDRLTDRCDSDTQLDLYWTLRTKEGPVVVSPQIRANQVKEEQ